MIGALDDVAVTQASAVWELRRADPYLRPTALLGAAMRIGRDHVASAVNTLVLAYAGAALPLLLLFSVAERGLTDTLTTQVIATEVVRTLVGSIGLVASVPLTTALTVAVVTRSRRDGGPAVGYRPTALDPVGFSAASAVRECTLDPEPELVAEQRSADSGDAGGHEHEDVSQHEVVLLRLEPRSRAGRDCRSRAGFGARRDPVDQCMGPPAPLDDRQSFTNVDGSNASVETEWGTSRLP
jgi:hypothetical protein